MIFYMHHKAFPADVNTQGVKCVQMFKKPLHTRNKTITIIGNRKCKTKRILCASTYENYNSAYVGQTSRELHKRFTEHRATIRKRRKPCGPCLRSFQQCMSRYGLSQNYPISTCSEWDPSDLKQSEPLSLLSYESETRSQWLSIIRCEQ